MLKVSATGEQAVRACIRACRNTGGYLARLGDAAFQALSGSAANPAFGSGSAQLVLWAIDGEGLPPRPWRIGPDFSFRCAALRCPITAGECVERQKVTDAQRPSGDARSSSGRRCQVSDFPSCDTLRCAQGRGIREALDPSADVAWQGARKSNRSDVRKKCRAVEG